MASLSKASGSPASPCYFGAVRRPLPASRGTLHNSHTKPFTDRYASGSSVEALPSRLKFAHFFFGTNRVR